MDVSGIAALASGLSSARTDQSTGIFVLKKSLDVQATTALALIDALPAVAPAGNLPDNLGRSINTTA